MGMSFGHKDAHDPPYPPEMQAARERVQKACDDAGIVFLEMVQAGDVVEQIDRGVGMCPATEEAAEIGRRHSGRTMPW